MEKNSQNSEKESNERDEPFDLDVFLDDLFEPIDKICRRLGKRWSYFAPIKRDIRLFGDDFQPQNSDERGNFIPVRFPLIAERLVELRNDSTEEHKKRSDFARISAARFHYDALKLLEKLRESFAPFDPDSDNLYEREYTPQETEEQREEFSRGLERALEACNYDEINRTALNRILEVKIPGMLPVAPEYDDFVEFHIFARGVVDSPPQRKGAWRNWGRELTTSSQTISRVCVFARLKRKDSGIAQKIQELRKKLSKSARKEAMQESADEIVIVKLFKDVPLEDLKMVAPKIKMRFQPFDLVKIWGGFAAGSGSAIAKFIIGAAFNIVACCLFMFGFLLLMIRNLFKFINRRTAYLQKYAYQLYYHTLASNFAAVNALVTEAEEQEIKEFVLGYFAALIRNGWATEREIDEEAEAFLKREFGLDVDFESSDALRKLREKKMLEEREYADEEGNVVVQYRVKPLDDALAELDKQWDRFFEYNV